MNKLLSNPFLNSSLENNSNQIVLDLSGLGTARKEVDIQTASIEVLSDIIVSKMMSSLKEDIASLPKDTPSQSEVECK